MFDYIEKLRQKSPRAKKQIAFTTAFCFAGIIFTVWAVAIYPNFKQGLLREQKVESAEPSPTSALSANLYSGFESLKDQFTNMKEKIFSAVESSTSTTTANTTTSMDVYTPPATQKQATSTTGVTSTTTLKTAN